MPHAPQCVQARHSIQHIHPHVEAHLVTDGGARELFTQVLNGLPGHLLIPADADHLATMVQQRPAGFKADARVEPRHDGDPACSQRLVCAESLALLEALGESALLGTAHLSGWVHFGESNCPRRGRMCCIALCGSGGCGGGGGQTAAALLSLMQITLNVEHHNEIVPDSLSPAPLL